MTANIGTGREGRTARAFSAREILVALELLMVAAGVLLAVISAHRTVATSPAVIAAALGLAVAFYAVEITPLQVPMD